MAKKLDELLLEMKDASELMVDLSYSSLLYNNKEIAQEIFAMEEMIDDLDNKIQQEAVNQAIKDGNVDKALTMIKLSSCIEDIADAAMSIADVVLRDIEPHPVFKISLRESDVMITKAKIREGSILAEKTLGALKLASECGMWVIAIKRGTKWIFGPDENTKMEKGDILIARGPAESERTFLDLAHGRVKEM